MYSIANKPDLVPVLSTLAALLRKQTMSVDRFLQQMEDYRVVDPFQDSGDTRMGEEIPGADWKASGMHRLIVDNVDFASPPATLPNLVSSSSIIEFADWAAIDGASGCWDCLYTQVIKPMGKRDFHFVFHLGDIAEKLVFEVDEVLDIIGDYSLSGTVTLMLDNTEADHLWCKLNGRDPIGFTPGQGTPAPGARYGSLFKTMKIDSLVVLYPSLAVHFSRGGLFDIERHFPANEPGKVNDRRSFSIGYQLGLLLRLDTLYCTALGLALSSSYSGPISSSSSSPPLLDFIQNWLAFLSYRHVLDL